MWRFAPYTPGMSATPDGAPGGDHPSVAEATRALALLREIGMRHGRFAALPPARIREFVTTGDFIHADPLPAAARARAERLLRHRWTGLTLFDAPELGRLRSANRADAVLLGARRSTTVRLRAFVFGWPARTLAVQERTAGGRPTALLTGAEAQRAARLILPDHVPRVVATGTHTSADGEHVYDWTTEDLVDGSVVPAAETEPALLEVLALLHRSWEHQTADATISHEPLRPGQRRSALDGFTDLCRQPPPGGWPDGVAAEALLTRVESVLARPRPLTIGLTHGDPSAGNLLRDRRGTLQLLDWEFAGRRLLAHDVAKVLRSSADPLALAATVTTPGPLRERLRADRALPWRVQVGVALLLFGTYWRDRHARAVARGVGSRSARGLARSVQLVDALLEP